MPRLIAVGFLSLLVQVACLRELDVASYGVELIYPLALAVWLLWTAAGAFLSARWLAPTPRRIAVLLLVAAFALPLDVAFIRGSRIIFGGMRGAYLPLELQLATLAIALLPPGFLMGLLFQWSAKAVVARGRTLAEAYAIESLGAVLGGLAATAALAAGIRNFAAVVACSGLCGLWFLRDMRGRDDDDAHRRDRRGRPAVRRLAAAGTVTCTIVALVFAGRLDLWMTGWSHPGLVASRDSAYGRVTIRSLGGQVSVFENDALSFDTESTAAEELAHLAALQHSAPRRFLILGGTLSGLVREALKHAPERVVAAEVDPALSRLALPHLPEAERASLGAGPVRAEIGEPRHFLLGRAPYDVILVGMPDPMSAQTNRFYTREFFALCRKGLAEGGVLAFSLSGSENLLAPPRARRLSSIVRAARAELEDVLIVPAGSRNIVLASRSRLARDPETLVARLRERGIAARLVIPPYLEHVLEDERGGWLERIVDETDAPVNSDLEPICYQYTALDWLSRFVPAAAFVDVAGAIRARLGSPGAMLRAWPVLAAAAALIALARLRPGLRRAALAAVAGFTGMSFEAALLLHYQVKSGVLFQDVGILLMAFMLGLAGGAAAVHRIDARSAGRRSQGEAPKGDRAGGRLRGLLLLVAFAVLCGVAANAVRLGGLSSLAGTAAALAAAGALTAAVFAHASLHGVADQERAVSPLYAADLLGGCLAAAITTLLAVPALGIAATLAGAGAVALVAVFLV